MIPTISRPDKNTILIESCDDTLSNSIMHLIDCYNRGQLMPSVLIGGFKQAECDAWNIDGCNDMYIIDVSEHQIEIDIGDMVDSFIIEDYYTNELNSNITHALVRKI
jgi:hypothetical protein